MHQLGYVSANPVFEIAGLRFYMQVFTSENYYEPDPDKAEVVSENAKLELLCGGLIWAGGQERAQGSVSLQAEKAEDSVRFRIRAEHAAEPIRRIKLALPDIRTGKVAGLRSPEPGQALREVPEEGMILNYPDGWVQLFTPLLVLAHDDGSYTYFRCLDGEVRPKTFALFPAGDRLTVELLFEEKATRFGKSMEVPVWEVGTTNSYEAIMDNQRRWMERAYGLEPWEHRRDMPEWARHLSLVASVHGQHWTGYIYNTYDQMLEKLKWLAERIEPRRVLAYLPGWEGRYYFQFGDLRPDPRMGGEEGFARLIDGAKRLGMRVMPMFMINGANPRTEGFASWGEPSIYQSAGGYRQNWGSCDWDTSRHYGHNTGHGLNPGAPAWQDRLVGQVNALIDRYGFDGVFMDLAAVYVNDPRYDTHQGMLDVVRRIRDRHPDVLMAGEGWFDATSTAFPYVQPALTASGPAGDSLHHDSPYPPIFDTYNREFGHLGTGDPARGSTGVFEFGYNFRTQRMPLRKGVIPTVTIVDDTIDSAPGKVEEILADARRYAELYL